MPLQMVAMVLMIGYTYASSIAKERELDIIHLPATTIPSLMQNDITKCEPCICKENNNSIVAVCTGRHLSSIPNISRAANISILLMDSNDIKQLEEGCLSNYTNLVELNLALNNISMIHIGAFRNLHKLQVLNLTENHLQYTKSVFKSKIFKPLKNLKILSLNMNSPKYTTNTRYPDTSLSDLVSLKELYLDGLTNQSFGEGFSNLTNLTHLSLAGQHGNCYLFSLFNNTFTHLKHLTSLNLSKCNLRHIALASFVPLRSSLEVLDLSYNKELKINNLFNGSFGLQFSSLRFLNISYIVTPREQCVVISKDNFKYMRNTRIEEIYADGNRIQLFESGALARLPTSLRKVSLRSSWLAVGPYILETVFLKNLTEIDLGGFSGSRSLPTPEYMLETTSKDCLEEDEAQCRMPVNTRDNYEWSMLTTSADKLINNVNTRTIFPPANLKIVKYTFEELAFHISALYLGNNSIENVNLSYNLFSTWNGPVKGMNKLKYLDLSNNVASHAKPAFFQNFPSLITLNISYNLLNNPIANDSNGDLFKNLTSLKILDLSTNNLQRLPKDIFKGLSSLEVLKVSKNNLYYVHMHVKHMKHLQKIDFSFNKIRWLPRALQSELDSIAKTQPDPVTIDLSYNPISCECPDLDFLKWMQNTQVKQVNMTHYYCLNSTGHNISLIDLPAVLESLDAHCANHGVIAFISLGLVVLSMSIYIAMAMYTHRWKIRYLYYGARYHFKGHHDNSDNTQVKFQYFAFISFAEEDKQFVYDEMMTSVEERAGRRLNIHQRDFHPGKPIPLNVLEAIKTSRKTVLVLSRHFVKSKWCEYEMQMAINESEHTRRDVLFVLMMEDIECEIIPKKILHLLGSEADSYLEYQPGESKEIFWQRFIDAIERS